MKKKLTIDPLSSIRISGETSSSLIARQMKMMTAVYMTYLNVTSCVSGHLKMLKNLFLGKVCVTC